MHAVLLAAGVGRRLTELTGGGPKCLLPFDGASLLERHLRVLAAFGVHRLTVVTGCEAMQIEQALGALVPEAAPEMTVDTVQNPDFRLGSAISVLAARDVLAVDDDLLLMDADVLYDARMLKRLLTSDYGNCFLLDREFKAGDEPVKLCVRDGVLVGFDKQPRSDLDYDTIGESVGFFRFTPDMATALFTACERTRDADPEAPHEHAICDLLLAEPQAFGFEDVTGLPWIEIDFPEDAERAENEIAPQLETTPS